MKELKEALIDSKRCAEGLKDINEHVANEYEKLRFENTSSDANCNNLVRKLKVEVLRLRLDIK